MSSNETPQKNLNQSFNEDLFLTPQSGKKDSSIVPISREDERSNELFIPELTINDLHNSKSIQPNENPEEFDVDVTNKTRLKPQHPDDTDFESTDHSTSKSKKVKVVLFEDNPIGNDDDDMKTPYDLKSHHSSHHSKNTITPDEDIEDFEFNILNKSKLKPLASDNNATNNEAPEKPMRRKTTGNLNIKLFSDGHENNEISLFQQQEEEEFDILLNPRGKPFYDETTLHDVNARKSINNRHLPVDIIPSEGIDEFNVNSQPSRTKPQYIEGVTDASYHMTTSVAPMVLDEEQYDLLNIPKNKPKLEVSRQKSVGRGVKLSSDESIEFMIEQRRQFEEEKSKLRKENLLLQSQLNNFLSSGQQLKSSTTNNNNNNNNSKSEKNKAKALQSSLAYEAVNHPINVNKYNNNTLIETPPRSVKKDSPPSKTSSSSPAVDILTTPDRYVNTHTNDNTTADDHYAPLPVTLLPWDDSREKDMQYQREIEHQRRLQQLQHHQQQQQQPTKLRHDHYPTTPSSSSSAYRIPMILWQG